MQRAKFHQLILLSTVILITSFGCGAAKKAFLNNTNWIPADFNPRKDLLLIEDVGYKKPQKKIEAYMQQVYPFKYAFYKLQDTTLYKDTSTYRFALFVGSSEYSQTSFSGGQSNTLEMTGWDFYFIDMVRKKTYRKSGAENSYIFDAFKADIDQILRLNGVNIDSLNATLKK